MKLSDQLKHDNVSGDFGKALEGYAERAEALEYALENTKLFAIWVESLGSPDCEIYKHELKISADFTIERIEKALAS